MDAETRDFISQITMDVANAIRSIAHGGERPTGLEMVTMALAGGDKDNIAIATREGLSEVASAIHDHALAVEKLARALGYREDGLG